MLSSRIKSAEFLLEILFALVGGIVILASIAPLLDFPVWWIRGFDFPRL